MEGWERTELPELAEGGNSGKVGDREETGHAVPQ
jgi:hypothetical protein